MDKLKKMLEDWAATAETLRTNVKESAKNHEEITEKLDQEKEAFAKIIEQDGRHMSGMFREGDTKYATILGVAEKIEEECADGVEVWKQILPDPNDPMSPRNSGPKRLARFDTYGLVNEAGLNALQNSEKNCRDEIEREFVKIENMTKSRDKGRDEGNGSMQKMSDNLKNQTKVLVDTCNEEIKDATSKIEGHMENWDELRKHTQVGRKGLERQASRHGSDRALEVAQPLLKSLEDHVNELDEQQKSFKQDHTKELKELKNGKNGHRDRKEVIETPDLPEFDFEDSEPKQKAAKAPPSSASCVLPLQSAMKLIAPGGYALFVGDVSHGDESAKICSENESSLEQSQLLRVLLHADNESDTGLCAATLLAGLRVKDFVFEEPIVLKPTLMEAAISDGIVAEAAGRDWFRGQPATNATDPEIADWFRNKPAAAAGSDWFRGHPATNDTDAEIVDWFRNKPAAAAESDWFRGHPATNDTNAEIVDWFKGQPATNDTDAEIADWFRGQPAEPDFRFEDFSFEHEERLMPEVSAVEFTNSINTDRHVADLFKKIDIDGNGLISCAEVIKACKDPKNEKVRQMLGLPKKMDKSSRLILEGVFQGMDKDQTKSVDERELQRWMGQVKAGEGASYHPPSATLRISSER